MVIWKTEKAIKVVNGNGSGFYPVVDFGTSGVDY
jgi:hypothetical protein